MSVGHRPQVDEAYRLDTPGAHLVDVADAGWFGFQLRFDLGEAAAPMAAGGCELAEFVVAEGQRGLARFLGGGGDVLALRFQNLPHLFGFVLAALGKLADGDRKSTRLNSSHLGISYAVFC